MHGHRWIPAALVALPFVLVALLLSVAGGRAHLVPDLDPARVARIRIDHGARHLDMVRGPEGWRIASAADAPADERRIAAFLDRLARTVSREAPAPMTPGLPIDLRLLDDEGALVGAVRLRPGAAQPLAASPSDPQAWKAVARMPPVPTWPSAWTSLDPPRIAASAVVRVEQLGPQGPVRLDPPAGTRVAQALAGLTARDFRAAADIGWSGARLFRLTLADGTIIDVQAVPAPDGGTWVRLTSDTAASVRSARRFAFRLPHPL
jgi:hypothetical protein